MEERDNLSYLADLCQVISFMLLLQDASNNQIAQHLELQDRILDKEFNKYLKTIVEQNKEIKSRLAAIEEKLGL